ncbi:Vegetative incompatibility protein HET-E-1, partial [Trametes pubescens]
PWAKKKGYAILSHVWCRDKSEQSFADIERLCHGGVSSYDDLRVDAKVRGCVCAAREQGFGWIWNDTCCIDTRSSAELEEAINSMFRWYAEAAMCLAYLQDVPDNCPIEDANSAFRGSGWFKRGWTLQELLAPHCLVFLSVNWQHLGTKFGLADLLQDITGIDAEVLTFHRALQHVSVARRMS